LEFDDIDSKATNTHILSPMNYPNLMAIVCLCFLLLTAGCYNTTTEQREDPSYGSGH